jgi:hypothetical protein
LARAFVLEHQYSSSDVHEIEEGDGREYQQAYPDTLSRKRWVPAPVGLATGSRQDWFPHGACNDNDNDNDDDNGGGGGNKDDDTAGDKDVDETLLVSENKLNSKSRVAIPKSGETKRPNKNFETLGS